MAATTDRPGDAGTPEWEPDRLLDTPLGHELQGLARRILGPGPAAVEAIHDALSRPVQDRLEAIARTAAQCRNRDGACVGLPPLGAASLAEAAGAELARANAALPARHREVLALRELPRLSHRQIGQVLNLEPAAVALLVARARLQLRDELRGPYPHATPACDERDRALRILARRQDSEPVGAPDENWIFDHVAKCPGCERAHAVMLEASFRYRAWVGQ